MKTIGIKLADGSFYPILNEGTPDKKTLDLTTAKDNQTTVMVDLYRSETGTMEDAEYVDTLQVDHLVAHPNGEPDLSFNISLDENNKLSAEINDPESGEHSDTTITLVSRTLEQRMADNDNAAPVAAAPAAGGLLAAAENKKAEDKSGESTDSLEDLDLPEDIDFTEKPAEESSAAEKPAADMTQDFTEPEAPADSQTETYQDTLSFAKDALEDKTSEKEKTADDLADDTVEETNFDMPDFSNLDTSAPAEESPAGEEKTSAGETQVSDDFSLPDFNEFDVNSSSEKSSADEKADSSSLDDFFADTSTQKEDSKDASSYVKDNTPSNGINFDGLYDKETEQGNSSTTNSEKNLKKKTKMPVLICIICAIICLIAVLLILFVIPSKYNLLSKNSTEEQPVVVQPAEEEPVPEAPAPEAKEDEVVVAPAAETVVPEKPAEPEKKQDIVYHIKWGDTLWDIADAYYKNPWRYHKIARYNHIKDPDYIISGTTINLPQE